MRGGVEAKGISGRRVIYRGGIDPIDRQILGRQILTKQSRLSNLSVGEGIISNLSKFTKKLKFAENIKKNILSFLEKDGTGTVPEDTKVFHALTY